MIPTSCLKYPGYLWQGMTCLRIWNNLLARLLRHSKLPAFKILVIICKLMKMAITLLKKPSRIVLFCIYLLTIYLNVQDDRAAVMSRQYIGCFVCGIICCQRKCLCVVKAWNCMARHCNSKFLKWSHVYVLCISSHKLLLQFWYFSLSFPYDLDCWNKEN